MMGRWSELLIGSVNLQDDFADQSLPQRDFQCHKGITVISSDSTSSSSRAIVKNVEVVVENPVKNFVTMLVLRLNWVPHLRVTVEIAKKE